MSTRYFKSDDDDDEFSRMYAIGDQPRQGRYGLGHDFPMATMSLDITPRSYIPHFGESSRDMHAFGSVAKALGVHPDYVSHVFHQSLDDEESFDDDDDFAADVPNLIKQSRDKWYGEENEQLGISPERQEEFQQNVSRLKDAPQFKHIDTLFTEVPPKVQVSGFYADPSMKASAMVLGALAMTQHGVNKLVADDSLSEQSSRLAQHGEKLGLVQPHPDNPHFRNTNDIEEEEQTMPSSFMRDEGGGKFTIEGSKYRQIPEHEVQQARQVMRSILRPNKGAKKTSERLGAQFDHPKLPGLEDY